MPKISEKVGFDHPMVGQHAPTGAMAPSPPLALPLEQNNPGLPQIRPRFANVNQPSPGAALGRSSHGLQVGTTLGELRLSAV